MYLYCQVLIYLVRLRSLRKKIWITSMAYSKHTGHVIAVCVRNSGLIQIREDGKDARPTIMYRNYFSSVCYVDRKLFALHLTLGKVAIISWNSSQKKWQKTITIDTLIRHLLSNSKFLYARRHKYPKELGINVYNKLLTKIDEISIKHGQFILSGVDEAGFMLWCDATQHNPKLAVSIGTSNWHTVDMDISVNVRIITTALLFDDKHGRIWVCIENGQTLVYEWFKIKL